MSKLGQRTEALQHLLNTASNADIQEAYKTLTTIAEQNPSRRNAIEAVSSIIRDYHPDVLDSVSRMIPRT